MRHHVYSASVFISDHSIHSAHYLHSPALSKERNEQLRLIEPIPVPNFVCKDDHLLLNAVVHSYILAVYITTIGRTETRLLSLLIILCLLAGNHIPLIILKS